MSRTRTVLLAAVLAAGVNTRWLGGLGAIILAVVLDRLRRPEPEPPTGIATKGS